jgi:PKD domain-containing protein
MKKVVLLAIIGLTVATSCTPPIEPVPPGNDFKVHTYYVVPTDKNFSQDNSNRVWRAILEMQRWYQTATGGLTFEILDEENIIEVYFTDQPTSYYKEDWWTLLLTEMKDKDMPVQSSGTIAMLWIEGISQINDTAIALGGPSCDGECGAALMPIQTIIAPTWPPVDMGVAFHEMGHTLGLTHPVDEADLPLSVEDQPLLYSVMNQSSLRKGTSNAEHGFLTFEKAILVNNPFLKPNVPGYQDFWQTNILNYPVTGPAPEPVVNSQIIGPNTVSFSTNTNDALLYYWYFGDGTISNDPAPSHNFSASGLYNITLMVTDKNYMATRVSQFVQIP